MEASLNYGEILRLQNVNKQKPIPDDSFTRDMVADGLLEYKKSNGVRIPAHCICDMTLLGTKLLRLHTPVFTMGRVGAPMGPYVITY